MGAGSGQAADEYVAEWLPTDPPRPVPPLLTEAEAIIYLRLDTLALDQPGRTLKRYRNRGELRATRIGNQLVYRHDELRRFVEWKQRTTA